MVPTGAGGLAGTEAGPLPTPCAGGAGGRGGTVVVTAAGALASSPPPADASPAAAADRGCCCCCCCCCCCDGVGGGGCCGPGAEDPPPEASATGPGFPAAASRSAFISLHCWACRRAMSVRKADGPPAPTQTSPLEMETCWFSDAAQAAPCSSKKSPMGHVPKHRRQAANNGGLPVALLPALAFFDVVAPAVAPPAGGAAAAANSDRSRATWSDELDPPPLAGTDSRWLGSADMKNFCACGPHHRGQSGRKNDCRLTKVQL